MTQQGIDSPALFLVLGVSLLPKAAGYQGLPVLQDFASWWLVEMHPRLMLPWATVPSSLSYPAAALTAGCIHSVYMSEKNSLWLESYLCGNISLAEVQGARALGWMSIFLWVVPWNPRRYGGCKGACLSPALLLTCIFSLPPGETKREVVKDFMESLGVFTKLGRHGKRVITCSGWILQSPPKKFSLQIWTGMCSVLCWFLYFYPMDFLFLLFKIFSFCWSV